MGYFEDIAKNIYGRIELWFDIENDPIFSPRFRKAMKWVGYTGIPAFLSIVTIILFFYIYFRIYGKIGFEKTVVSLLIIIVITLRSIKPDK